MALLLEKYLNKCMKIRAIVHPAEEGGYWAEVPALPGCITEGDTIEEVIINLKDAMVGWLEVANSREAIASTDRVVEIAV
ncbi:type II toxin-antitoxin system HicB family antitoxin [Microcoleus sp. PH2017_11_PCY_U_A]|uniref:type II toxin-antitoxin system HicB family antitoxin n=1 Tax=unclassified Microcoleus TaxID=2642155 RepID=UPI00344452B1